MSSLSTNYISPSCSVKSIHHIDQTYLNKFENSHHLSLQKNRNYSSDKELFLNETSSTASATLLNLQLLEKYLLPEILIKIASFLDLGTLKNLRLVDRKTNILVTLYIPCINIEKRDNFTEALAFSKKTKRKSTVKIGANVFTNSYLKKLPSTIKYLQIKSQKNKGLDLFSIINLNKLVSLDINQSTLYNNQPISSDINSDNTSEKNTPQPCLNNLQSLRLYRCESINQAIEALISIAPNLQILNLISPNSKNEIELSSVFSKKLEKLSIDGYIFSYASLENIIKESLQLKSLVINLCYISYQAKLISLNKLYNLEYLHLSQSEFSDKSFIAIIDNSPNLKFIKIISIIGITDDGIKYIANLKKLESLAINEQSFSEATLEKIGKGATSLKSLDIYGCEIFPKKTVEYEAVFEKSKEVEESESPKGLHWLQALESLTLISNQLSEDLLKAIIENAINLKKLNLYLFLILTKALLESIAKLKYLTDLDLGEGNFSDEDIEERDFSDKDIETLVDDLPSLSLFKYQLV